MMISLKAETVESLEKFYSTIKKPKGLIDLPEPLKSFLKNFCGLSLSIKKEVNSDQAFLLEHQFFNNNEKEIVNEIELAKIVGETNLWGIGFIDNKHGYVLLGESGKVYLIDDENLSISLYAADYNEMLNILICPGSKSERTITMNNESPDYWLIAYDEEQDRYTLREGDYWPY